MITYAFDATTADMPSVVTVTADNIDGARRLAISAVRKHFGTKIGPGVPIHLGFFTTKVSHSDDILGVRVVQKPREIPKGAD